MTVSISTLLDGHEAILRSARMLLTMIALNGPPASRASSRLASLAATVATHEAQERGLARMCAASLGETAATAGLADEHALLDHEWAEYLAAWPSPRIAREVEEFYCATRTILPRLMSRIERENHYLYPHALATGELRLI